MKHQNKIKSLPEPTAQAIEISKQLVKLIKRRLHNGKLSFAEFMQMALYSPGLGYYANGLAKIGANGDFITAPEISPIFSQCLARQSMQVLANLTQPNILEFGAGRGVMARDILLELAKFEQPIANYFIVELSADLRQIQQQTLQDLPEELLNKVIWLDKLPGEPIEAVVLANEVLDAMPVERLKFESSQVSQAFVVWDEEKQNFSWDYQPVIDKNLQKLSNQLLNQIGEPLENEAYFSEINLNIAPWLASIHDFLQAGMVLLIDYGYPRQEYYQTARSQGTLRCHYQHRAHSNPFFYPGLQDITAHVDFTSVAQEAHFAGFKIAGYTTQAHFLISSGLLEIAENPDLEIIEQLKIAQQVKTLTFPDEMGENFKVIALTKNFDQGLNGFKMRDLRHQL